MAKEKSMEDQVMSAEDAGFEFTEADLMAFLERREKNKAKAKERGYGNYWEKQKQRMANDPEYAKKVKEQRKAYTAKALETAKKKFASDPEFADKVRARRREYTKKRLAREKALLQKAKEAGLI